MSTATEILEELRALGSESIKRMLMKNHGVKEPCFGVKIGDMQKIRKRIKQDHELALALYDSGNYDAMYLAAYLTDDARMTKADLQRWADAAYGAGLPGTTVPWVASGSPHGREMALKWIDSKKPHVAVAGWSALSCLMALKDDADLDLTELTGLIERVKKSIHATPDVVKYAMNGFLISAGSYVKPLMEIAIHTGEEIGRVEADLGSNSCEFFYAPDYIRKVQAQGTIGKKRKTMRC
ncbi:DNA alkylation repair protein [Luteolibacter arcticus]|uniref:DNA alkylation repair protein n=1 Tax=Luteolibacter arcticus TaxID=1581411 RepID=A0ABT3GFL7_9BACT|nr:DNA alkylation repair protein [Luteolibacter arcticus]MCW1922354.1 DNA alkylation repair protein [Luteolibacter arcticus]